MKNEDLEKHFLVSTMECTNLREELNCSICLNIYTDPVTLRCGHNFCRVCIKQMLDSTVHCEVYTCPECRKRFSSRPALQKNTTLCNIVKHVHPTPPEQIMDGIFCTYCIETCVPAAKSCLVCEASLCSSHLRVHCKSPEHVLIEPITFPKYSRCAVHTKFLDYFCAEDSTCVYCQAGALRNHLIDQKTKPTEKENLKNVLEELIAKRDLVSDQIHYLLNYRTEVQRKASDCSVRTIAIFVDLRKQLQILERRILNEILRQEEDVLLSTSNMIRQLGCKKLKLSQQILHIEALNDMVGPLKHFPVSESGTDINDAEKEETEGRLETCNERFNGAVDLVEVLISETLHRGLFDIVINITPLFCAQEAIDVFLDANTAGCGVVVSRDKRTASWSRIDRKRPKNPERFQYSNQVLSTRSFAPGGYYWEVETSKDGNWRIGVAYPSVDRKSEKSRMGDNNKSWCLCRWKNEYSVRHDGRKVTLPKKVLFPKLGLYLNSVAGTLSFYELGDPIEHLYTFTATFAEPLHAALGIGVKGWLTIKKRNQSF